MLLDLRQDITVALVEVGGMLMALLEQELQVRALMVVLVLVALNTVVQVVAQAVQVAGAELKALAYLCQ
jgi:hypothetical protein